MIPVYQTKYGKNKGNCFQAVLASLFETSLEDIPDFCNVYPTDTNEWYGKYTEWLNQKGYSVLTFDISKSLDLNIRNFKDCYLLVSGLNENEVNHCVIYKNGKSVHNPNKKCSGIKPKTIDIIFPLDLGKK